MAVQWGNNSLAPGQTAGWYFVYPAATGFLPVISVIPLSPSFTSNDSFNFHVGLTSVTFPVDTQLGVSTMWSHLTDDGTYLVYSILVMNFGNSTVEYAFVEASL
jgi:hypothetical protein